MPFDVAEVALPAGGRNGIGERGAKAPRIYVQCDGTQPPALG